MSEPGFVRLMGLVGKGWYNCEYFLLSSSRCYLESGNLTFIYLKFLQLLIRFHVLVLNYLISQPAIKNSAAASIITDA